MAIGKVGSEKRKAEYCRDKPETPTEFQMHGATSFDSGFSKHEDREGHEGF
ncbi:MAG TPA: hypothetical protein VJ733_01465 [Candidatus Binatia bacterium]|nr:hypothetical protein [Candidatus Binatia bacterium]